MMFDQVFESMPSQGWLTKPEASLLWDAAKVTEGPILEVGAYAGRSTVLLAGLWRPIYTVDPFNDFDSDDPSGDHIHSLWLANIKERGLDHVRLFRQKIEEWQPKLIGFAYLDGDHTYQGTVDQIRVALAAGARSVCIHDYATDGGGVEIARAIQHSPLIIDKIVERMAYCKLPS